jgi:hypothetical protein
MLCLAGPRGTRHPAMARGGRKDPRHRPQGDREFARALDQRSTLAAVEVVALIAVVPFLVR